MGQAMTAIRNELERFHQFALERIAQGTPIDSLDELFLEWQDEGDRDTINAAIERGLQDVEQGRFERSDEMNRSLRQEFGLPEE